MMPWQRPPAWLYLPHLAEDLATAPAEGGEGGREAGDDHGTGADEEEHPQGNASSGLAIRGRATSPGCGRGNEEQRARDAAIRGLAHEPGPAAAAARNRAEARLAASHSHIWRSLEDHRERVEKRKREDGLRRRTEIGNTPSASERLAALRRRIEQRVHGGDAAAENAAREAAWHAIGGLPGPPAAADVDRQVSGV